MGNFKKKIKISEAFLFLYRERAATVSPVNSQSPESRKCLQMFMSLYMSLHLPFKSIFIPEHPVQYY